MHEFALSQHLLDSILVEMKALPAATRLLTVRIRIGELRQVVEETLRFAFENLAEATAARGAQLEIAWVPLTAGCPACGWNGPLAQTCFLCPECGSGVDVKTGMELSLDQIEVETPDEPSH